MKKSWFLISIFNLIVFSVHLPAQLPETGFFLGGGASMLMMNGTGKLDSLDLNLTGDLINFEDEDKIGWGWNNKSIFGIKPVIGYKISPTFTLLGSYNFQFQKEGEQSDDNFSPIPGLITTGNFKSTMEYSQNTVQLLGQFYPSVGSGFFITGGLEYVLMKAKLLYSYTMTDPYFGTISEEIKIKGDDSVTGFVLGGGIELPLFGNQSSLVITGLYSFTNYKGEKLLEYDVPDLVQVGDIATQQAQQKQGFKTELDVGGFSANVGLRYYLPKKETVPEPPLIDQKPVAPSPARKFSFTPTAGITFPMGDGSEYWNVGFNIGLNMFSVSPTNISFGGRIAYNRIPPDGEELMKLASGINVGYGGSHDYKLESTSGAFSIIELVPSVKIETTKKENNKSSFSLQCGLGLFIMNSDASAKGSYSDQYTQSEMEISLEGKSETKFGLQFSANIYLSSKIVIQPYYNLIFTEENNTQYLNINLGYCIN